MKHGITIRSSSPTPEWDPRKLKAGTQTYACTRTIVAAVFTVTKKMEATQVFADGQIDRQNVIHILFNCKKGRKF